jgi:predicted nuclease with TOPRIM domain
MIHENSTLGEIIKHYEDVVQKLRTECSLTYSRLLQERQENDSRTVVVQEAMTRLMLENQRLLERLNGSNQLAQAPAAAPEQPKRPWWRII